MSDRIRSAMSRCPRSLFLPPDQRPYAAEDRPLPIGHRQTNSQPSTVLVMLRLLNVREGDRVLDVGAGSGWTTAILGELVGARGRVIGLELVPELAARAHTAVTAHWNQRQLHAGNASQNESAAADASPDHAGSSPHVEVRVAERGQLGAPDLGPFDRILVSAEAAEVSADLIAQLTPEGVMVAPVGGDMLRIMRTGADPDDHEISRHGRYRFVPLIGD